MDANDYELAAALFRLGRHSEALTLYKRLAAAGDPASQVFLGWMYFDGVGTGKDREQARLWFLRAAESGHAEGMFYLGRVLTARGEHGDALKWYERASEDGFTPADYRMGIAYLKGQGVAPDPIHALTYLRKASASGSLPALYQLALIEMRSGGVRARLRGSAKALKAIWLTFNAARRDIHAAELKW
jgi:TPR repeat protein